MATTYVRGADGREYWTTRQTYSRTSSAPRDEMTARFDSQCRLANCGDRNIIGGVTVITKRGGAWNHKNCPAPVVDDNAAEIALANAEMAGEHRMNCDDAACLGNDDDAADALLDEYNSSRQESARAAALGQFMARKLIYRVSLTGEAKKYGVDVVNVQVVPNAKYANVKFGEFRGVGVGRVEKNGQIRFWNDVDQSDARVQAVVAAVNILMNAADPVEFAKAYATESHECARCGDDLVDDGNPYYPFFGPVCGRKFGKGE